MKKYFIDIYGERYQNVWEVAIVNNEIECANRIVYETGTYKAVVVCGLAGGCFISSNEVSRMP